METREYDHDARGVLPPASVLAMLTLPGVLRARAAVRLEIARQDAVQGDTWAASRNGLVAQDMLERAREMEAGR